MATARGKWCLDDLDKAMQEVKEHGLSIRKASYKYGIPRSTIMLLGKSNECDMVQALY